ncbi:hypothetical protein KIW84_056385 [Lathyrus oleraceus]|uniref:RRM domain-containing protein n=1 Tax=Pisum sativum TaxID=3888 RepID=A0A9D4X094_PEA|nr:hypothetical protein KIW84_056385 [Pisum sativum]
MPQGFIMQCHKDFDRSWQHVRGRRRIQEEHSGRFRRLGQLSYNSTSFFFTSFPSRFFVRDMYEFFQYYGKLDEVIIPSKKDVRGRRYGFIRFFNVTDSRLLATKLDNSFLDNVKLHVNIPKFGKAGKLEVFFSGKDGEVPRSQPLQGKSSIPPNFDSNLEAAFKRFNRAYFDVARILVRTGCSLAINKIFSIKIEVVIFRIKLVEETHVVISIPQKATMIKSREDSDSKSLFNDLEGVREESSWGFS